MYFEPSDKCFAFVYKSGRSTVYEIRFFLLFHGLSMSPVDKGPKQQPDDPLNVFSAQPAPLLLHQQTQDVQCDLGQRHLRCCCAHDMQDTDRLLRHTHSSIRKPNVYLKANIIICFRVIHLLYECLRNMQVVETHHHLRYLHSLTLPSCG